MRYQDEVVVFGVESYGRQFGYMMTKTLSANKLEVCVDLVGFFHVVVVDALEDLI